MTQRERVFASIHRRHPDALPWQFDLTRAVAEKLQAYYGTDQWREELGDHFVWASRQSPGRPEEPDPQAELVRDEFGAAARQVGAVVMIHSCGNITELLPDLIEIGVQVVHPLQPEAMDVEFCQREYGAHLSFWGGLGSQSTLPLGTPDQVRREVRARLELFRGGGYILAPAGAAPAETPAANIAAIAEVAKAQLEQSAG